MKRTIVSVILCATLIVSGSFTGAQAQVGSAISSITYVGLAAGAFGHDDPLQIQTRAMRFFQEKILHHRAIENPEVWVVMGDSLMLEQHLINSGVQFKPPKLGTLSKEVKRQRKANGSQSKDDAQEAESILKDIRAGLKSPADYVLAARHLYLIAIEKADARALQEAKDHKDEKRLLGRLSLLSGETDRTQAIQTRDNSIVPLEDELGSRVSFRLDAAAMMERYGSRVPELGWNNEAARLRLEAQSLYSDANLIPEPVRRRLHQRYPEFLKDSALQ